MLPHPTLQPLNVVSVRQYRTGAPSPQSGLLRGRPVTAWITPNQLAACFASGHDPSAYGTFTLWNTQIHGLYSPFKAHTWSISHGGLVVESGFSAFWLHRKNLRFYTGTPSHWLKKVWPARPDKKSEIFPTLNPTL